MSGTITDIIYNGSPANLIPPGAAIVIAGAGFNGGPVPSDATITFTEQGGSGTIVTVTAASTGASGQITGWAPTQIDVTLPAAVNFTELGQFTWNIQVSSVSYGVSSTIWGGTYFIPTITGITPNPAQVGQTITLSGTFAPTQGILLLAWDAVANTFTPATWDATTITAVVPAGIPASFVGVSHEFGLYWPGRFPLVPPFLETQFPILVQGPPVITSVAPGQCAPGQTCEVVGNGFGATQGTSTIDLNGSPVTPTSWSNGLITFVVPLATPIGAGTITISHTGFPSALGFFNVTPALFTGTGAQVTVSGPTVTVTNLNGMTPAAVGNTLTIQGSTQAANDGTFPIATYISNSSVTITNASAVTDTAVDVWLLGTKAVQGQPVSITGTGGFGAVAGKLIYFSANGLTVVLTLTDWTDTAIFANIPASADLGPGTIWLILNGNTGESGIFGGFTVGQGFAGPQVSAFIPSVTWVTSPNVNAYPRVQYMQGNQLRFEAFPRGKIKKLTGDPSYDVEWLTQIEPFAEFELVSAPSTDLAAIGTLTTASINALGLIPPPPNLASFTTLNLTPTSGMGGSLATVDVSGAAPQPIGTVTLSVDGTEINNGNLVAGMVSFNIPESTWITGGAHSVTAVYLGDTLHLGSSNTQTFTFVEPPMMASAAIVAGSSMTAAGTVPLLPFVSDSWNVPYVKDDGTVAVFQTADVSNDSQVVGIDCTITHGSNLVPTFGDLPPYFSAGTKIVFNADGTSTPYTILSINSSQITLTGNYTGVSSSSFGTTVAYSDGVGYMTPPTGTFQFKINGTNFSTPQALVGSTATMPNATGGVAPLTPDGNYTPGGLYSGDSIWASSVPNVRSLDLIVYHATPTMSLSTQLLGTFNVQNGSTTVLTSVSQVGVLAGGEQVQFSSQPATNYTVSSIGITATQISLGLSYTGSNDTVAVATESGVKAASGENIALLASLGCSQSPSGPTPTGTFQMYLYNITTAAWESSGTWGSFSPKSLTPNINTFAQAQSVVAANTSPPFNTSSPGCYFSYSFTSGDSNYDNVPAPSGGPPPTNGDVNYSFIFTSAG